MKAAVVVEPHHLEIRDIPTPTLDAHDVLVKVYACGVCGTDLHIYEGRFPASLPLVMGHEFAGVVVDIGDAVEHITIGDRVAIQPNINCGMCTACRTGRPNLCDSLSAYGVHVNGGFAQYCRVHAENAYTIGDMSFDAGAFVEPLSCCLHGIRLVGINPGERVIVFGAGPIGLLLAQLCRAHGATEVCVVDLIEERLRIASDLKLNALSADDVERERESHAHAYDLAIDATGVPAVMQSLPQYVHDGGRILIFGVASPDAYISVAPFEIYRRELTIVGAFSLGYEFATALELLRSKCIHVKPLISHMLPLEDITEALAYKREGTGMKVIILPNA